MRAKHVVLAVTLAWLGAAAGARAQVEGEAEVEDASTFDADDDEGVGDDDDLDGEGSDGDGSDADEDADEEEPAEEPAPGELETVPVVDDVPDGAATEGPQGQAPAARDPWQTMIFEPGMQAFGEYALELFETSDGSTDYYHQFDVPRVWLWLGWQLGDARARVLLEGTRAGGAGALVGVGGDSIVVRLREAWAGYRAWDMFEVRVGVVPTLTAPAMTEAWGLRPVSQTALRRFELMQPADLGATLTFTIPDGYGVVGAGVYNGEGYRGRELNRGKNTELFAQIHPLAMIPELRPLTVLAGWQLGSSGTDLARSDRLLGALAWIHPRLGLGFGATWIMGYEDRGGQEGVVLEGWARGEPIEDFILGARVSHFSRDFAQEADALTELTATVGYRLFGVVTGLLAVDGRFAGDAARAALPGYERWRVRVVVEGRFSHPFQVQL